MIDVNCIPMMGEEHTASYNCTICKEKDYAKVIIWCSDYQEITCCTTCARKIQVLLRVAV